MAESQPKQRAEKELNLHQKLLKIADAAGILQKSKSGFNYKYVPEEEIQAKVTACMQKYGVMLYHSIVPGTLHITPYTYTKYNGKEKRDVTVNEFIVHAETTYTWVNAERPEETVVIPWVVIGQMEDASQAFGAGETYCNRYFLMKTLQLATSEADPDAYRSKQKEAESYEEDKKQKEESAALEAAIKEIKELGSQLIKLGVDKSNIYGVVAKYNGNENPSSIKSLDICAAVANELKGLLNNATAETASQATTEKKTTTKPRGGNR